jgi:hypothetical protein
VETATSVRGIDSVFHSDDLDQVAEYRSLSALAVLSLVFGLASPVCAAHPFFMVIPLVGAAIAIAALQRIAASDGALAGRWAATAGLVLCVVSAVGTISYDQVTRILRTNQAKDFASEWLHSLAAGNTEQAFRLTTDSVRRPPPPGPHEPVPQSNPFDEFKKNALIQSIAGAGDGARIQFVETLDYQPAGRRQYIVVQHFKVTPAAVSNKEPVDVMLTLQRSTLDGETRMRWLVRSYQEPNASTNALPAS